MTHYSAWDLIALRTFAGFFLLCLLGLWLEHRWNRRRFNRRLIVRRRGEGHPKFFASPREFPRE